MKALKAYGALIHCLGLARDESRGIHQQPSNGCIELLLS